MARFDVTQSRLKAWTNVTGVSLELFAVRLEVIGARPDGSGARLERLVSHLDILGARTDRSGAQLDNSGSHPDSSGERFDYSGAHLKSSGALTNGPLAPTELPFTPTTSLLAL